MHSVLGFEIAVRELPGDLHGRALDPGSIPVLTVHQRGSETLPLAPPEIHPEEHLPPVLRLSASRPGMDREDGIPFVVVAAEHVAELEILHPLFHASQFAVDFQSKRLVTRLFGELQERLCIRERAAEEVPPVDPFPAGTDHLHHFLGRDVVVPELRGFGLFLELPDFLFFPVYVKDTPGVSGACPSDL